MKNLLISRENSLFPASFSKVFDRIMDDPFISMVSPLNESYPKMDIFEDDRYLTINVSIPGVKKEDVVIEQSYKDEYPTLEISCDTQSSEEAENIKYHIQELRQYKFKRKVRLPKYIVNEPEAILENGILTLKWEVPKEPEPKRIAIQ